MKRTATEILLWTVAAIAAVSLSAIAAKDSYSKECSNKAPHTRDFHQKGFQKI